MLFYLDDLPVLFPYDRIYPEQYQYMADLKKTLDAGVSSAAHDLLVGWINERRCSYVVFECRRTGSLCIGNAVRDREDGFPA
ncbi:hypothetical protein QFC21_004836 [Naganishia friedmannii]|uniref:Uncharacterized protein n=1 Tax=Naganishia friedmannii TaxID=89922 RepID=A0ACC2VE06_9TREE|nr:hypothetical protein QFC21_004836 [Naganishia friedmannii]